MNNDLEIKGVKMGLELRVENRVLRKNELETFIFVYIVCRDI